MLYFSRNKNLMTCEESQNLLNAHLDGELSVDDRARLDAHLAECSDCRAAYDALLVQNGKLLSAFAPRRRAAQDVANRVISQLPHRSPRRIPWWPMLLSAAAGFAVAFGLFHGQTSPPVAIAPTTHPASQPAPIAQLALTTGAVEFRCPGDAQWSAMATGGSVASGTSVRTGPNVRCEFHTPDGSEIRLNADTQLEMKSPRRFELAQGQVWSTVAHAPQPFEAKTTMALFTAMGTQFDLSAKPEAAVLTVVEGSVRVDGNGSQKTVESGQRLTVTDGHLGEKTTVHDLALATRWVNEILVMKGRDNPELAKRIDDLFAQIGQQKMGFLFEEEIRALGDHCVIPLTKYIESDRSQHQPAQRATAARIVCDVAPQWAIPNLIELLQDRDGEVRYYAATALRRLTGQGLGRSPEQWRNDNLFTCRQAATQWGGWWKENRERYPGMPPADLPKPKETPVAKDRTEMKKG